MSESPSQETETIDGKRSARGLGGFSRFLASFVATRKIPVAIAAAVAALVLIGAVLWMTGLFGDGQTTPTVSSGEAAPAETVRTVASSTGPVHPVTAVPSDPECQRAGSASQETDEISLPEIEKEALTGVVQVLTDVGEGSGIVADPAGLIVTDSQVVKGSWLIKVRLASGETVRGDLFGISEDVGVAYIEVATDETLTAFPMGNSDDVCIGDAAFAVGFARGSPSSVATQTSAKSRISSVRQDFLWTDISLGSGIVGGPLIDASGNVIGVNSSGIVVSGDTVTSAASFAIPIDGVKQEINDGLDQSKLTTSARTAPAPTRSQ